MVDHSTPPSEDQGTQIGADVYNVVDVGEPAESGRDVPERLVEIESLRAIAALGVFFTHVGATKYAPGRPVEGFDAVVRAFLDQLTIGVQIFFAISGFVLYRPFARAHLYGQALPNVWRYATRRAARIYPAYWVALVACVLLIGGQRIDGRYAGTFMTGGWRWFANLLLVQSYNRDWLGHRPVGQQGLLQAWTLVTEVTFYIALPCIAAFVRFVIRRFCSVLRAEWIGVGVVATLGLLAQVWGQWGDAPSWISVLPKWLPYFACGMAIAVATTAARPSRFTALAQRNPVVFGAFIGGAFIALVVMNLTDTRVNAFYIEVVRPWMGEWFVRTALMVIVAGGCVLVAMVIDDHTPLRRGLRRRTLVWLGSVSYGIYLWHYAIVFWLSDHWFGPTKSLTMLSITAVGLPTTLLVAWISLQCIENPAQRLAKRRSGSPRVLADDRNLGVL